MFIPNTLLQAPIASDEVENGSEKYFDHLSGARSTQNLVEIHNTTTQYTQSLLKIFLTCYQLFRSAIDTLNMIIFRLSKTSLVLLDRCSKMLFQYTQNGKTILCFLFLTSQLVKNCTHDNDSSIFWVGQQILLALFSSLRTVT